MLLELHYSHKWNKSAAAKKRAQAEGISVWEVEQCLDTDLFLDENLQWEASSPHQSVILQGMFAHVETAGWKEIKWAIHCGYWQSYPGLNDKVEVPAIQLVGFKTTREDIQELYNDVYQLKRSPDPLSYGLE